MGFEDADGGALGFPGAAQYGIAAGGLDGRDDLRWSDGAGYGDELRFKVGGDILYAWERGSVRGVVGCLVVGLWMYR